MQLTLPSEEIGKTKAWLLLEQGDLAGKRYELMASICSISRVRVRNCFAAMHACGCGIAGALQLRRCLFGNGCG
jgi:hypothetical protein